MYTIEQRSYGIQVTVDSALEPHEIEELASELKHKARFSKKPYEPFGIFVRPSEKARGAVPPKMYVVD
jgi:hypothetical protein